MRALTTITKSAGILLREDPHADEEKIIIKSLFHLFYRLIPSDVAICENIVKSHFPSFDPQLWRDDSELQTKVIEEFKKMGFVASKNQVISACGLKKALDIRHSVICLGGPMSGKSTAI